MGQGDHRQHQQASDDGHHRQGHIFGQEMEQETGQDITQGADDGQHGCLTLCQPHIQGDQCDGVGDADGDAPQGVGHQEFPEQGHPEHFQQLLDGHGVVGRGVIDIVHRLHPMGAVPCHQHQNEGNADADQIRIAADAGVNDRGESEAGSHTHDAGDGAAGGGIGAVGIEGNGHVGNLIAQNAAPGRQEGDGAGHQRQHQKQRHGGHGEAADGNHGKIHRHLQEVKPLILLQRLRKLFRKIGAEHHAHHGDDGHQSAEKTDIVSADVAVCQKQLDQTAVDHGHGGGQCAVLGSHVDNVLSTYVLSHNAPLYDKEKHIGKVWVLLRHYSTHPYPGRQCKSEKIYYFLEKKRGAAKPP